MLTSSTSLLILLLLPHGTSLPWSMTPVGRPFHGPALSTHEEHREKRYALRRKRWAVNKMSWHLDRKHVSEADEYIIRNTLHRAFNEWSSVADVEFVEELSLSAPSSISIAFERGFHDDKYPFDGRDGIVAHAFYPRDGRLHFDADEEWTLNQPGGVNLFQTALHEIGHLLGLEHSSDPRAAMFASKRPYTPLFGLSDDDVRAVRVLFPYPTTADTPTTSTTTTTETPSTTTSPSTTSTSSTSSPPRRPIFRLRPLFSSSIHHSRPIIHSSFSSRSRGRVHRKRLRGYSMLTLGEGEGTTRMNTTSFFQANSAPH